MQQNRIRHVLFPLLAAIIWGSAFVAQDMCVGKVQPLTFNAVRSYVGAAALLVVIALFRRRRKGNASSPARAPGYRRHLLIGGMACGTALALAANLQQAGLDAGIDVGKSGFITALYIVLVPLFGLFLKKRVSLPVWCSVALAVAGLYFLCMTGMSLSISKGEVLTLLCAAVFSIHILVIDHFTALVDGMELSFVQFLVAGTWSAVGMLLFEQPRWSGILSCALPILYVGIFSSGVAYTLQILAQKDGNPTVVCLLLSTESVFSVISGAIILHEALSSREYLGCALMLVAVMLAQIPFPARSVEPATEP